MNSEFKTPGKVYSLKTDSLCCNKFGLAEFLAEHFHKIAQPLPHSVLDVGCGAGPLGIYFADQFSCNVVGVELNPIACTCCRENLEAMHLTERFSLVHSDFQQFVTQSGDRAFDLIVSNPPIDTSVSADTIRRYAKENFENLDTASFAYLTNSWHISCDTDLLDLIFRYGQTHLTENGRIVLVFCLIDCMDSSYVIQKALHYHCVCTDELQGKITSESIGAGLSVSSEISAYIMNFRMEKGVFYGN